MKCDHCEIIVDHGEFQELRNRILCDDCYIETAVPKVRKTWNPNAPGEFMNRLKDICSVHPQKYH